MNALPVLQYPRVRNLSDPGLIHWLLQNPPPQKKKIKDDHPYTTLIGKRLMWERGKGWGVLLQIVVGTIVSSSAGRASSLGNLCSSIFMLHGFRVYRV